MAVSITCWTVCLTLLLVALNANAQNFETGDNSTVKGCSTHCSYHDKDLSCWTSNLNFFERVLLGQIRHYVSVQINIDQFNKRHQGAHYKQDFKGMRDDSIKRISSFLTEEDFINHGTIDTVITELVGRVENKSQDKIHWMPHYSCPIPCEYRFNVWRNLFIASMILNVCLVIAVMPYAYKSLKSDDSSREGLL